MDEVCRLRLEEENSGGGTTELRNSSAIRSWRAAALPPGGGEGEGDRVGDLFALCCFFRSLRSLLGDECDLLLLSSGGGGGVSLLLLRLLFSLGRNSSSTST